MGANNLLGHFAHYKNDKCEFFPCHKVEDTEDFNCLFCFCPLYCLGPNCGGDFIYTPEGVKDCRNCTKPHGPEGYDYVMSRISAVTSATKINIKKLDDEK